MSESDPGAEPGPTLATESEHNTSEHAPKAQPADPPKVGGGDEGQAARDLKSALDGDQSRRDEGVRTMGFRKWLYTQKKAGNPSDLEFIPYFGKTGVAWPIKYSVEAWTDLIYARWPDEADDVTTYMLKAEASWRAEMAAASMTAEAYGIAPATLANKLSYRTPQTDTRCGLEDIAGRRCNLEVVPGSTRCAEHGGALIDPETRRALLLTTYASLVSSAQIAVDALVDVAENSRNDLARVSASKEILDRVGLTPELNINVTVSQGEGSSPVDKLKKRLDQMSERLHHSPIETSASEATLPPTPSTPSSPSPALPSSSQVPGPDTDTHSLTPSHSPEREGESESVSAPGPGPVGEGE